jgi:hypothetical protein
VIIAYIDKWYRSEIVQVAAAFDRLCGLVVRIPGYRSRGPGFDPRHYEIFREVMDLERGPSVVSTIEELLGRKSTNSGLENREYGHRNPLC